MTAALNAASLQRGLDAARDVVAALSAGLASLPADEAVLLDAAKLAAMIDPALAPAAVALPIAEAVLAWVAANNTQGRGGSETPMHGDGARGGAAGEGGRIEEEYDAP